MPLKKKEKARNKEEQKIKKMIFYSRELLSVFAGRR